MTTANKITVVRILMIPAFVTMAIYYGQSIQRHDPLEWQRFTAIAIFLIAAVSVTGGALSNEPGGKLIASIITAPRLPTTPRRDIFS